MRRAAAICLFLAAASVPACINDRDTVAYEMRLAPQEARSLVGWFDRLPPEYYETRIARLKAKSGLTPNDYDDWAVALERMGRSADALAVIQQKAKLSLKGEDLYRLHANRGTFLLLLWLRGGAKPSDISLVKRGEKDIATAVRLNPGSHFGRESTQLELMRWLIATRTDPKHTDSLGMWLEEKTTPAQEKGTQPTHAQGLAGLISLGAAWESVDVAAALAYLASKDRRYQIAHFARLRVKELRVEGKKPISQDSVDLDLGLSQDSDPGVTLHGGDTVGAYKTLKAASEARHRNMIGYVQTRLNQGAHPDTDPAFWSGWEEPPMPAIPEPPNSNQEVSRKISYLVAFAAFLLLSTLVASIFALRWIYLFAKRRWIMRSRNG